jgi:hypothetical protein
MSEIIFLTVITSPWEKGKQLYIHLAKKYLKIGLQRFDKT